LKAEDLSDFTELLDATCRLLSRGSYAPNDIGTAMFFRALSRYSLKDVRGAFDAHMADPERGRFVPAPADLIAQLDRSFQDDGRPGPEEAFAMVQPAFNEDDSVVWTEEMAHAWGACRALDNEVSRRMVFKETYVAAVAKARADRKPVNWMLAEGNDHGRRVEAVKRAQMAGIPIEHHRADELLSLAPPKAPVALLTTDVKAGPSEAEIAGRAKLADLLARMKAPKAEPVSPDAEAKAAVVGASAAVARTVAEYAVDHGIPLTTPAAAKRAVIGATQGETESAQ
jgi:hypothetical protein